MGLLLALFGVHGVLAYAVSRRTSELGLRGALGATSGRLRAMVLGDALRLGAIGVAIGVPLAMVATRLIEVLLEGTHQGDPVVYGLTIAGVLSVTIVAGMAAARRAIRVSVIAALRSD